MLEIQLKRDAQEAEAEPTLKYHSTGTGLSLSRTDPMFSQFNATESEKAWKVWIMNSSYSGQSSSTHWTHQELYSILYLDSSKLPVGYFSRILVQQTQSGSCVTHDEFGLNFHSELKL